MKSDYRLPIYWRTPWGLCLQIEHNSSVSALSLRDFLSNKMLYNNQIAQHFEVLKFDRRTRVVKFQIGEHVLVAKIYAMNRFKDSLRHKKYGFSEFYNNLVASRRGTQTPNCYAYFENRNFGLVKWCGVVMEYLEDHTPLTLLLETKEKTIYDVIPLFYHFYLFGINHVDLSPYNIFVNRERDSFTVIDWQHCSFCSPKNALQLCLMSAIFLCYVGIKPHDEIWLDWTKKLYKRCCPDICYEKMTYAIALMADRQSLRPKDRLRLNASRLGLKESW